MRTITLGHVLGAPAKRAESKGFFEGQVVLSQWSAVKDTGPDVTGILGGKLAATGNPPTQWILRLRPYQVGIPLKKHVPPLT